ncbi:MAG: hypothetical protein JST82_01225 [Bacteroidetes bacterium]|nr:hypothetical protein [Bacteroidota bacterium]
MKKNCGIIFAGAFFVLLQTSMAQNSDKLSKADTGKMSWQQYDSLAAVQAFNTDTIGAMESYLKSLQLNPDNKNAKFNYEKLDYLFIKSYQSMYDINP